MERPVKGDIVVIPFPFSDLSASRKRPALVVANLTGDDVILSQITSAAKNDFNAGNLKVESRIRPNRLFTADKSIVEYRAGTLKKEKMKEVEQKLISIFTQ